MVKGKYAKKASERKQIALERIAILFEQAANMFKKDRALANRYVHLARELSMKYKVPIPNHLKKRFCKNCNSYLVPSVNVRIRTREGKVVYYCLECKHYMRFPYVREQKARKRAAKQFKQGI